MRYRSSLHLWLPLCCLLLIVAAGQRGFAEQIEDLDLLRMLDTAPGVREYPEDDALFLQRNLEITLQPSGALTVHEHKYLKMLTTRGLALANWEIAYDKSVETLTVKTARTLLNGQAFPVESKNIAESAVYPGWAWYDSRVIRRFPFSAATLNAVFELDTTITRAPRMPGALSLRLPLRSSYPILASRIRVRVPKAVQLAIRFPAEIAPPVKERVEGAWRDYTWSVGAQPAMRLLEPMLPPREDLVPMVRITTLPAWEPVARWYAELTTGKDTVTDALRAVATTRTAGCNTAAEQLAALHKAVRAIPYVAMEVGDAADVPHSADDVLKQGYGDCKDKATLLRALLRAVGIDSSYVLVRTTSRGALDRTLYGPDEFNHVILAVHLAGGDRYVDATIADVPVDALPPGVDGAEGLLIRGAGTLVTLPISTAQANGSDVRVAVTVRANGSAKGTVSLTMTGQAAMVQRGMLAQVPPDQYREGLEGGLAPRLGADITIDTVKVEGLAEPERPLVITAEFSSPAYLQPAGAQLSGYLPIFGSQANPFRGTKTRTLPFYLSTPSRLHLEATITLPATLTPTHLPTPVTCEGVAGSFKETITTAGQILTYRLDILRPRGTFPATELPAFQQVAGTLALEGRNQLQFFVTRKDAK